VSGVRGQVGNQLFKTGFWPSAVCRRSSTVVNKLGSRESMDQSEKHLLVKGGVENKEGIIDML